MHSRFPNHGWENSTTSGQYSVLQGFSDLFEEFEPWFGKATGAKVHGHLFAPDKAHYAGEQGVVNGALSDSAEVRDYNPRSFLTSLIWNTRGERQCFQFGPADNQDLTWLMAADPNAQISVISGAWAVPLFRSNKNFSELRTEAAGLQKIESEFLDVLRSPHSKARIRVWTMADFIENPMEHLQTVIDEIGFKSLRRLAEAPKMNDLTGFGQFLQNLKNQRMHPYLMGDFPVVGNPVGMQQPTPKPYLVKK